MRGCPAHTCALPTRTVPGKGTVGTWVAQHAHPYLSVCTLVRLLFAAALHRMHVWCCAVPVRRVCIASVLPAEGNFSPVGGRGGHLMHVGSCRRAGRVPDPLERTGRGAQRLFPCSLATFPATAAGQFVGAFQLPPTLCVKCTYRQPRAAHHHSSPPPHTACIQRTTEQAHVCMLCSLSPLLMRCRHIPAPSYESREAGGGKREEEGEATK